MYHVTKITPSPQIPPVTFMSANTGTYTPGTAPTSAHSSGKKSIMQTLLEQNASYHS